MNQLQLIKRNSMKGLFKDEAGTASSKRVVGVVCSAALCITLFANSFSHGDVKPSDTLVNAVSLLAFGCLGLTSIDKYTKNKTK